jgi:hypothetical protein
VGRKHPGLLKASLGPEILITVLRAVRRNFVNLAAASHFFSFSSYLNFIFECGGGYIVVTC